MITRDEKRKIQKQVDAFIINLMIKYDADDLEKVGEIILQEVEDMLESEVQEKQA